MEGIALVGGFMAMLVGMYFVFFHMDDYLKHYEEEEGEEVRVIPEHFRVAISNANLVPLVLRVLEEARRVHPDIQYVLTMGTENALMDSVRDGSNDVIVVSPTVNWMGGMTVRDVTVKPPSILLDEGDIALKPLDTSVQTQKIIFRKEPSALVDEFVQALCAYGC